MTDHVPYHERIFDDNLLPNRFAELLFEVLSEKDINLKQLIEAVINFIMRDESDVIEKEQLVAVEKEISKKEVAPTNVDEEPTMAQIALCGFSKELTGMAFSPLLKMEIFSKWVYQIIKTIPYCYPMRHKKLDIQVTGNNAHRTNVLATVILGLLWNNKVTFGEKFPKKRPEDPADKIPMFMDDVLKAVKDLIKDRARIVRSNYRRSVGILPKAGKRKGRPPSSKDEDSGNVGSKRKEHVVEDVVENPSPKKKSRLVNSKGKKVNTSTIASDYSEVEESPTKSSPRTRGKKAYD